ncbi:MAG: class I SAM-dependent methyltransferase, partial [Deltaproteobacteria bacterium]|nr:class I SAM-dependent methyltransferase [Deltaproteobacteria bacterium]
ESFPRYDKNVGRYETEMLQIAVDHGVDFKGKTVLDVGCGSGQFTIRLARLAERVVAVDLADKMLEISKAEADRQNLTNIDYVLSSWTDFPLDKPYDLVFASMCPALRDDEARAKLLEAVGGTLMHVGFTDYVDFPPMAGLLRHFQIEPKRFRSGPEMALWMDGRNKTYKKYEKTGVWEVRHDHDEALRWCSVMLADFGVEKPDPGLIRSFLAPSWVEEANAYVLKCPYFVEMLIWDRP